VVVVTEKLFEDGDFSWDVSDQSFNDQLGTAEKINEVVVKKSIEMKETLNHLSRSRSASCF
jgi:hypothetical protein